MSGREKQPVATGMTGVVRPAIISVAIGAGVCVVLLLLCSVVLASQNLPQSIIDPMATAAITIGALAAGFVLSRMMKQNGLLFGLISSAVLALIVLIASFGVSDAGLGMSALFKTVFMLLAGMIGGIMGVNAKPRRKKIRR